MSAGCPVADSVSPIWTDFVDFVCSGDSGMASVLQVLCGASAFGRLRDHRVDVFVGDGGNGKSVFANTIVSALGSYAGTLHSSALNANGDQHPTAVASLEGKRLVMVPECDGGTFKAEILKTLSGGDLITARFMRRDFFEFQNVANLFVLTNEPPAVAAVNNALRRRIRIWPFDNVPEKPDPRLSEKLACELPSVLRWIAEGARRYDALTGPIQDCQRVVEASSEYFEEQDSVGRWFQSSAVADPDMEISGKDLRSDYVEFCRAEELPPVNPNQFGIAVSRLCRKRRTKAGVFYHARLRHEGGGLDGKF